jgi:serine/threonine protein phosphatase PrpC
MIHASTGSTATICLIVGDDVYVTNCGDSAAYSVDKEARATILTECHSTENPVEVARCKSRGGRFVTQVIPKRRSFPCCFGVRYEAIGKPRLYPGGLLITRAFGDFNVKLPNFGGISDMLTSHHGDISHIRISDDIKYIILGSDGLWDALTPLKVVEIFEQTLVRNTSKRSTRNNSFVRNFPLLGRASSQIDVDRSDQ